MRLLFKLVSVLVVLVGFAVLAIVVAPSLQGQARPEPRPAPRPFNVLNGLGGAGIGVSIHDVDSPEATRQKIQGGAVVDDITPSSPADKAGLKPADVIVEFDGERVRSAAHLARLVRESAPGQSLKAVVVHDGQKRDVQITPANEPVVDLNNLDERVRRGLGDVATWAGRFPALDFGADLPGLSAHGRLGVMVQDLSKQLADYFGATDGLLVSAVNDNSPASRAGLKAGDIITSINGTRVSSAQELTRAVRDADRGDNGVEVTIGIVRDKKENSVKATLPATRRVARATRRTA